MLAVGWARGALPPILINPPGTDKQGLSTLCYRGKKGPWVTKTQGHGTEEQESQARKPGWDPGLVPPSSRQPPRPCPNLDTRAHLPSIHKYWQ